MNNFVPRSFHYTVDIQGYSQLTFTEVSGLQAEMVTEELNVGGRNNNVYKLPVRVKHSNLVLKRAFNTSIFANKVKKNTPIYTDWLDKILNKGANLDNHKIKETTKDITVNLIDPEGNNLMVWSVKSAYPVKWLISNYSAKENTLAIETIEFTFISIEMNVT
ncbi:MAG: phage tail protein [Saprospiraceae bacterium]